MADSRIGLHSFEEKLQKLQRENAELKKQISKQSTSPNRTFDETSSSEEQFRALIDKSPIGLTILGSDYRMEYANPSMAQMLGLPQNEIEGMDFRKIIHSEDLKLVANRYKRRRAGEKVPERYQFRLLHSSGESKHVEIQSSLVSTTKGEVKTYAQLLDISEQKKATDALRETNSRLSNMMRAANDGMWDWDLISGTVVFDPRYYEMAGYKVNEFPYQLSEFQQRVHPDDLDQVMKNASNHLEGKTDRFIVEFRFLRKDERYMWILGRGIITERDADGNPLRLMGTHTDITELKRVMSDLQIAKEKAEESDRLKSAFLANMSHEIRTPMNGILGFAELLNEEGLTNEERKEYIQIIKRSGDRMLSTINDIIDISKIEAGQVEAQYSIKSINEHMRFNYEFFQPEAADKGLTLSYHLGMDDSDAMVYTDHEKLNAILSNLINNALKYSKKGEIHFQYERKNDWVEFSVSDEGIGIAEDRQEAIFERFVQADLNITKPYEGSGLGLSICKGFIDLLGGEIRVESELNRGSNFYFTIPFQQNERTEPGSKLSIPEIPTMVHLKEITVLIVEDDESALYFLNELLKRRSGKILQTKSGKEAVEIAKKDPSIGLILMDIKMPDLDGYEATRRIRQFNKEVVIIGQTAYALLGDRDKVIKAGCDDYITKPIDSAELFSLLKNYFG